MKSIYHILLISSLIVPSRAFLTAALGNGVRHQAPLSAAAIDDTAEESITSRRKVLSSVAGSFLVLAAPIAANALDVDAFANSQVSPLH